MSDATQADAAQSQADTTDDQQAADQASELKDVKDLPNWAQKLIRDHRKEAADYRTKLQKIEDRDKTDLQRAADKAADWEQKATAFQQRAREKAGRAAALEAARAANAVSAKAVYAIVRDGLEYDDDDEPTNLDALIAKAKKDEPDLFRATAGSGDGGKGGDRPPKDSNAAVNTWLRQAAGRAG